jgi:hypothetical protein
VWAVGQRTCSLGSGNFPGRFMIVCRFGGESESLVKVIQTMHGTRFKSRLTARSIPSKRRSAL